MAELGEMTVKITTELTETSKQTLKPLIIEIMREALEGAMIETAITDELKSFIRAEIDRQLATLQTPDGVLEQLSKQIRLRTGVRL